MKNIINYLMSFILLCFAVGCDKYADDYKKYIENKEIVYPGLANDIRYFAGNLRVVLAWNPSPDPNIEKYVVSWNNNKDSVIVDAITHNPLDSISVSIPDLNEYVYSFSIKAIDQDGNVSIGQEINNVRVYGPTYQSLLLHRNYVASNPYKVFENDDVTLYFHDADTLNANTEIRYTTVNDEQKTVVLLPQENDITLSDFKFGTDIQYRSGYVPEPNAVDTFYTSLYETFPEIIKITEVDKSLFEEILLPGDNDQEYGWVLSNIWNNQYYKSDDDNPDEGFHTSGSGLPQSFTFDMGQVVKLDHFRLWHRDNALYENGNIKVFEVWGSEYAPDSDGSWTGWEKLGTFTSSKPSGLPMGQVSDADKNYARMGEKFEISHDVADVRYLRFKVLETWGDTDYIHLSELTFFKIN